MIPTSNQLELDLFPEGAIVTEGTLADCRLCNLMGVYYAVQGQER